MKETLQPVLVQRRTRPAVLLKWMMSGDCDGSSPSCCCCSQWKRKSTWPSAQLDSSLVGTGRPHLTPAPSAMAGAAWGKCCKATGLFKVGLHPTSAVTLRVEDGRDIATRTLGLSSSHLDSAAAGHLSSESTKKRGPALFSCKLQIKNLENL